MSLKGRTRTQDYFAFNHYFVLVDKKYTWKSNLFLPCWHLCLVVVSLSFSGISNLDLSNLFFACMFTRVNKWARKLKSGFVILLAVIRGHFDCFGGYKSYYFIGVWNCLGSFWKHRFLTSNSYFEYFQLF